LSVRPELNGQCAARMLTLGVVREPDRYRPPVEPSIGPIG
jgi:hypothetical protein